MRATSVRPYASLVLVLVLGLAMGWGLINRYSVASQDQSYVEPARRFLSAAVTADSAQLTQLAVPRVIAWALETARTKPVLLSALLNGLKETAARQAGGTTLVLFSANGFGSCSNPPLAITFEGPPSKARLVALSADCEPRR
jgi:hypothetical protein